MKLRVAVLFSSVGVLLLAGVLWLLARGASGATTSTPYIVPSLLIVLPAASLLIFVVEALRPDQRPRKGRGRGISRPCRRAAGKSRLHSRRPRYLGATDTTIGQ